MGQGFQKFWRRTLIASVWRSVLFGASLAMAVFAVLLLLYKRMILPLTPAASTCIALGAGVVLAVVLFFALFPYKKRLARKLDRELGMREGVQTMLAFTERQDGMMQLQREQIDAKLRATPAKKLKIKHVWTCLVCFLLALGMGVTAFAIPAKLPEPPPAPVEPPFELSEWEMVALQNLIEQVQESTMTEPAKGQTVDALERLLEALRTTKTESRMKTLVVDTVMQVRTFVDGVVSLRSLAPIMREGGSSYTRELERALAKQDAQELAEVLDGTAAEFVKIDDKQVMTETVHVFSEELKMTLRNANVSEQDALGIAVKTLANKLADIAGKLESYTLKWGSDNFEDAIEAAHVQMAKAMAAQRYDADMGVYVETQLLEIFGLSASDLPGSEQGNAQGPQTPGDYEDDDDDQTVSDGGLGSGELIVGSQDVIYDPVRDEYVKYSEVIDRYNAIFLESKIDGLLSEETEKLIEAYFTALFSPSNKD